jgi:hypothetical protein
MIIDLPRFIAAERPTWTELERLLDALESNPTKRLTLQEASHFQLLYQKVAADLARLSTFASEPELRRYLEALTARAYGEIHETRQRGRSWAAVRWFTVDFPRVFRRHWRAFLLSVAITLAGTAFGGFALLVDRRPRRQSSRRCLQITSGIRPSASRGGEGRRPRRGRHARDVRRLADGE